MQDGGLGKDIVMISPIVIGLESVVVAEWEQNVWRSNWPGDTPQSPYLIPLSCSCYARTERSDEIPTIFSVSSGMTVTAVSFPISLV